MAEKTVVISQQYLKPIHILKWKVREGFSVSIGSLVLLYDFEKVDKKQQRKLKSPQAGIVCKLVAQEGAIIQPGEALFELAPCIHPTVMKDMCAECGADLRKDDLNSTASVPMIHSVPELKVSEELAQKLGKADGDRLLKDKKLVLLVDLDQTLIHTTNDIIPPNWKDVYHFQLYGPNSPWYHTRLRPGTQQFLMNMLPFFELHICTFGARNYAHRITAILDADQRFFSNRVLSRDECFNPTSKTANLKALFPCGDHMVCIIDDREDVWSHASNLIHVKPYHFFQHTGDINAPPGLEKHENDEKEGIDISKIKSKAEPEETIEDRKNGRSIKKSEKVKKIIITMDDEVKGNGDIEVSNTTPVVKKLDEKESPEESVASKEDEVMCEEECVTDKEASVTDKDKAVADEEEESTDEVEGARNTETGITHREEDNQEGFTDNEEAVTNNEEIITHKEESVMNKEGYSADKKEHSPEKEKGVMNIEEGCMDKEEGVINKEESVMANVNGDTKTDSDDKSSKKSNKNPVTCENNKVIVKSQAERVENNKQDVVAPSELIQPILDLSSQIKSSLNSSLNLVDIEDPDDYLLYLEDILKRIHKAFYDQYDIMESGVVPDLKKVIPAVKGEVLKGCKMIFSGLVPTHIKLQHSRAYQVAKSLGAKVTQEFEEDSTHLVAVRPGTAKVNAGRRRKNLKIVTPDWLWACAERWEHVEESIFPLSSKGSKNRHPPPHCSSPEHVPNYAVHDTPTSRKRTPSGRFMDTINPLMSFSSADIADMDKEVEDILDAESEESEEETAPPAMDVIEMVVRDKEENSSSSAESLTAEMPRGHKRNLEKRDEDEDGEDTKDSDEFPSTKFRRGEQLDSDLDIGQDSNSEGSVEPPDEIDDGEWNMMGAALEREFLSNS